MIPAPGGRARGRRDNGLVASSFSSVGDVDPRVGEHLLDVLALDGIAAYLQPTMDHDAVTRAVSLPRQPTDRLYVDRRRSADARAVVAAEAEAAGRGTGMVAAVSAGPDGDPDSDAVWADLVASYQQQSTETVPPWPAQEDTEPTDSVDSVDSVEPAGSPEQEPAEEDEEEGYVPPPPPPLPRISRQTLGGLLTIALGFFLLLLGSRVLGLDPDVAFQLGLVCLVAGAGYLIWRMRDDRSDEDRPDDGAVV